MSLRQPTRMRVDDEQSQDGGLQPRQRPLPLPALARRRENRAANVSMSSCAGPATAHSHDPHRRRSADRRRRDPPERSMELRSRSGSSDGCRHRLSRAIADRARRLAHPGIWLGGLGIGHVIQRRRFAVHSGRSLRPLLRLRLGHFGRRRLEVRPQRQRFGRRHEPVRLLELDPPDRTAAHATHLTAVGLEARRLDIVGGSARRADDQHRRIRCAAAFRPT